MTLGPISPYALVGQRLIDMGYSAIPIIPGTKAPGTQRGDDKVPLTAWRTRFDRRLPSAFEVTSWSKDEAGVGVVGGYNDVVGIDIDTEDRAIFAAIVAILPETEVRKAGAKGETHFFRGPGIASQSFDIVAPGGRLMRALDIIATGRQTLVPPTIHPDTGKPYVWTGLHGLEEVEPHQLPELPPDIADRIAAALQPFGMAAIDRKPSLRVAVDNGETTPFRAVNDLALANLSSWVTKLPLYRLRATGHGYEAVATWRSSTKGRPLEKRARNLKIHAGGIRDFGAVDGVYTPIDLVMLATDCDMDTAFRSLAEATGWSTGEVIEVRTAVKVLPVQDAPREPDPTIGDDLTRVPGLLGEVVDWIEATARRPSRILALGAGLCVLGTLIGRRVASPTTSATHLYVLGLAPTGAGKQHLLDCIERLMTAAKASHHIGPSSFMSHTSVLNLIGRQALSLCPQDEFGAFLKKIGSAKSSPHEKGISMVLRSLWGTSFAAMRTPEWAGRASEVLHAPALSLLGLSNPAEFYEALTGADVSNGFLNRFLVLPVDRKPSEREPTMDGRNVPSGLAERLHVFYQWNTGPFDLARLNDCNFDPVPICLPWADPAAQGVYRDLLVDVERRVDRDPDLEPYYARTPEIAVRMATIRGAGREGVGARVDRTDMEWAAQVAMASSSLLARDAEANMVEELGVGHLTLKVLDYIESRSAVTHRDLHRKMHRSFRRSSDLADVMKSLETSGHITVQRTVPAAGGPPTVTYVVSPQ